jgi:hypothetical protein
MEASCDESYQEFLLQRHGNECGWLRAADRVRGTVAVKLLGIHAPSAQLDDWLRQFMQRKHCCMLFVVDLHVRLAELNLPIAVEK